MTLLGKDTFSRSNQSGWGTASDGQTWSTQSGTPTLSIASNEGHATSVTALAYVELGSTTTADIEVLVRVKVSDTNVTAAGVTLRATGTTTFYRFRFNSNSSTQGIGIVKTISGTTTNLFTTSFTVSTGTFYWLRARAVGSNLYVKGWQDGTAEPAAWSTSGTDTSITAAGGFGVCVNSSSGTSTFDFDSYYAVDYPLADDPLTLTDVSTVTVVQNESESQTEAETTTYVEAFVPTETFTFTEISLNTIAFTAPTDTLTLSESFVSTNPTLLPDVALSISESQAYVEVFVPTETVTFTETPLNTLAMSQTDTVTTSDGIAGETYVPDSVTLSDVSTETGVFIPTESTTTSETTAQGITSTLSDTITATETIAFSNTFGSFMNGTDVLTVPGDSISFSYAYVYVDSVTSSDTISFSNVFTQYPYLGWDTFSRSNSSGTWGTATDGQTWSITTGAGTLAVSSNEGTITNIGALNLIRLGSKTSTDQEGIVRVAVSSTSFTAAGICLRMTATNTTYRIRINSNTPASGFAIVRTVTGTTTNIATTSFTASINTFYWIRAAVIGSTLYGKIWQDGTAEPSSWSLSATDTNITGAGGFGLVAQSSTSTDTASFDNFFVVDYALGDRTVYSLDTFIDSISSSTTDTVTANDVSTTTDVPVLVDTLISVDSIATVETLVVTETFVEVEQRSYAIAASFTDPTLSTNDFVSTIAQSTISNITGTDSVSTDDSFSSFIEQFNPSEVLTLSDSFSFSYTYNNPYAGTKTVANDTYVRANQSGWGTATDGATWSVASGTLTYAISSNQGTISGTSGTGVTFLGTESTLDGEAQITFQIKNNTSDSFGLCLRAADASNYYYTYYSNNTLFIKKIVSGTVTSLASASFTGGTSNFYHIRFVVQGSNLFSRIWQDGTAESSSWTVTTTDTALSSSGKTGVYTVSTTSGTITVYNYLVVDYRLADLVTFVDATTFIEVHAESDTLTPSDSTSETFVYASTDTSTQVEIYTNTEAYAATDTSTLSDVSTTTDVPALVDTLTGSELTAYVLNQNTTDTVTINDQSLLSLYIPIDLVTATESILNTLLSSIVSTDTTTDTISPTLIRPLTDDVLNTLEVALNTLEQTSDPLNIDTLSLLETYFTVVNQLESTTFTLTELFSTPFILTYPVDTVTELELYTTTVNYHENPVINAFDTAEVIFFVSEVLPEVLNEVELITTSLSFFFTYNIPFVIDASTTTVIQLKTDTLTEQEAVLYTLAMLETQVFTLIDASITTVIQTTLDALTLASSVYTMAGAFVPVDTLTSIETIAEAFFFSLTEQTSLLEQYLTTLTVPQIDVLTVGTELVAEVLNFGTTDVLTFVETLSSLFGIFTTDSLTSVELDAILIAQLNSDHLTDTEAVTYALSNTFSETLPSFELFLATASYAATLSQTLSEQVLYTVIQKEETDFIFIESVIYVIINGIRDIALTTSDTFFDVLSSVLTDIVSTSDTLTLLFATTFTGWVDILISQENTNITQNYQPIDTASLLDTSFVSSKSLLLDTVSAQEVLVATDIYAITDQNTTNDLFIPTTIAISSEILSMVENSTWQGIFNEVTGISSVESLAMQLAIAITEGITTTELPLLIILPSFIDPTLVLSEATSRTIIFIPIDLVLQQELLQILFSLTLLDAVLSPVELAPALGYALFDALVLTSDLISYTQQVFKLAYAKIRNGGVSITTRIGASS